jgi:hypothetical protein
MPRHVTGPAVASATAATSGTTDHAWEAAALEAEAVSAGADLDGASGLLIEAANQWRLAGDHDRCRALLDTVIARGGAAGCYARAELIGILIEGAGDAGAVAAQLAALAGDRALTEGPCQMLGEVLADHGMLVAALEWYERAVGYWSDARRAAAVSGAQAGRRGMDELLVQQRERIRRRLGS